MKPLAAILSLLILNSLLVQAAVPSPETTKTEVRDRKDVEAKDPEKEVHYLKEWKVPHDFFVLPGRPEPKQEEKDPAPETVAVPIEPNDFLIQNGVTFGRNAFAKYLPATQTLSVKNSQTQLDKVDALVNAYFAKANQRNPARK